MNEITLETLAPRGTLVILAPHPDDETLGCGGLIATAQAAGRRVLVVVATDGGGSHPRSRQFQPQRLAVIRAAELRRGLTALGLDLKQLKVLGLEDGGLDAIGADALAESLSTLLLDEDVGALFATALNDPHPDHRVLSAAAGQVADRFGIALWTYPIRAPLFEAYLNEPGSHVRFRIDPVLDRKKAAIDCHASQLGGLIGDDPGGFFLTKEDLACHTLPYEIFGGFDGVGRRYAA